MANLQDLVTSFHSLKGNFISEKRKNLNVLLNLVEISLRSEKELSAFITALTPRSRLEENFKVDVLIRFRRNGELLEVLKSGKPLLIKKVLNCWQFFRDTFENLDARTIVNELFPYTSFSTRVKVINRLSKNLISVQRADDYFKAIEDRYGLKTASIILPGCSLELIQSVLTQYKIKLTQRHLLLIIKKHRNFLEFYCKHVENTGESIQFQRQIMEHIAKTHADKFWQLLNIHTGCVRFGKRITSRMLQSKNDIIHFVKYRNTFKTTQILKMLKRDELVLRDFCLSELPNDIEDFHTDLFLKSPLHESFHRVKENKRYDVLNFYFREKYKQDLHNFPNKISLGVLKIMPVDKREAVLDEKVKLEEDLLYLYNTRKSIAVLKERINHTSDIAVRQELVGLLLKTCLFNKDNEALLYVLRYMLKRHKNDLVILKCFIRDLTNGEYLENLSEEHWDLINDLLKILEISVRNFRVDFLFKQKYVLFLVKNRLPYDEQLKNLLIWLERLNCVQSSDDPKFFFEKFGSLIPELYQDNAYVAIDFLLSVISYNDTKKEEEIPLTNFPEMLTLAESSLVTGHYLMVDDAAEIISYCIRRYDGYDSVFWEHLERFKSDVIIEWYLKTKSLQVIQNIEAILKCCSLHTHMRLIKKITYTSKMIQFYFDVLLNKDCARVDVAIPALSLLVEHEQYFEAIKDLYPPSDGKKDITTTSYEPLSFQKQAVENLKNLAEPSQCFPILLKFCVADYLQCVLAPLYHLVINTPEVNLPHFFEPLYNAAVSVRKHAVFLISIVCTKEVIYKFLKITGQAEKNSSLQKVVLRKTLKYFIENPSEAFWKLFQDNVRVIDENDREAHSFLLDLTTIPEENLPQYIQMVYEKLTSNSDKEIHDMKFDLMIAIPDKIIKKLDETFLKDLINVTFPDSDVSGLKQFHFACIFHNEGQKQMNLYQHTFNIWKNYIKECWSVPVKGQARAKVYDFVQQFCIHWIKFRANKSLLENFTSNWKDLFKPEEAIDEYLIIDFTILYFNCDSEHEFGSELNEYLHLMVQQYDTSIVQIFAEVMEYFISICLNLCFSDEKYFAIVEGFFFENPSVQVYLVLLKTLFKKIHSDNKICAKYQPMYELVRQCKVPIVQIHFKRYLRQECLDEKN